MDVPAAISAIRSKGRLTQDRLARVLGVSFVSVNRWERRASDPSPAQAERIRRVLERLEAGAEFDESSASEQSVFASRGARRPAPALPLFESPPQEVRLSEQPLLGILERVTSGPFFSLDGPQLLHELLQQHTSGAEVASSPPLAGMSAGKNTYTYDAHTYHTKVPPQGIAELLKHYLPHGGLVLDPFSGSGMTGVAAVANGYDCVLNELSPAACFISSRFTSKQAPEAFREAVETILRELSDIRRELYTTLCRECGRRTELLYTVWSYLVICNFCQAEFLLWDCCRKYGARVRDHKILTTFPCPKCSKIIKKSRLRRTIAVPVVVAYMCCGSRQQEVTHPLDKHDLEKVCLLEYAPPLAEGFVPRTELPDGVNLNQPKRHGLDRVDRFYTPRNLAAMSHLWKTINRIEDADLAANMAFAFTSLYQRVTRLSEFRFWGGSGNTARFNVPFIFNEPNVFLTFQRKARTIEDHLRTTAAHFSGQSLVVRGSATSMTYVPDETIDLVFADPPFGANINYSEMNILWEAWLGAFTDTTKEAIINKAQHKDLRAYAVLLSESMTECYRVLRPGGWLLLVFMNSSARVWEALRAALLEAGFEIRKADIFDKQHGTFKQFVSENTAGCDLVLHCHKRRQPAETELARHASDTEKSLYHFLEQVDMSATRNNYLHVERESELDYRKIYSEWLSTSVGNVDRLLDFSQFRRLVDEWVKKRR